MPNVLGDTKTNYSNEWYTPSHVIELARLVLGTIDLDPASSLVANETVKAAKIYTVEDDGLSKPWSGKVWCNPPYAGVSDWCEKMRLSYGAGEIEEGLLLVNANTETRFFQSSLSAPVCLIRRRLVFYNPNVTEEKPVIGSAVFYFGRKLDVFLEHFSTLGTVLVKAVDSCSHTGTRTRRLKGLCCDICQRRISH
jgi:phage N-6-adenine-methyltransferase